jgi:hypothetical protein
LHEIPRETVLEDTIWDVILLEETFESFDKEIK